MRKCEESQIMEAKTWRYSMAGYILRKSNHVRIPRISGDSGQRSPDEQIGHNPSHHAKERDAG